MKKKAIPFLYILGTKITWINQEKTNKKYTYSVRENKYLVNKRL